jgi:hypothetical protein
MKKEFKAMHKNLSLLQGMIFCDKERLVKKLNDIPDIKKFCKPVSNYGDIGSDKKGIQKTDIYQDGNFIFVETTIDNSKDNNTSRNSVEKFNTIYYKG